MRLFRRRPKVITITCRRCGTRMRVMENSVPGREQLCNSCAIREARRKPPATPFLP